MGTARGPHIHDARLAVRPLSALARAGVQGLPAGRPIAGGGNLRPVSSWRPQRRRDRLARVAGMDQRTFSVSGGIDEYARKDRQLGRKLLKNWSRAAHAARARLLLEDELAVLVEQLSIGQDLEVLSQIANHVPVDRGLVPGSRSRGSRRPAPCGKSRRSSRRTGCCR